MIQRTGGKFNAIGGPLITATDKDDLAKQLINPTDDAKDFLTLTNLSDANEALDVAQVMYKFQKYGLNEKYAPLVRYWLRARVSIKGQRVQDFLQAVTGVITPEANKMANDLNTANSKPSENRN
jgi:hypothetical protein